MIAVAEAPSMHWSGVWLRMMMRLSVVFALAAIVSASTPEEARAAEGQGTASFAGGIF
jgi:hypothetical protein